MEQRLSWKLTCLQLVNKFPVFYATRNFVTAFTSAHHLSLSGTTSIQSITPHPNSWRSNLILYSHLNLGLPMDSSSQVSTPKPGTRFTPPPYVPHGPPIPIFLILWLAQYWVSSNLYRKNLELFWDLKILKHENQRWQMKRALHVFGSHEGLTLSRFSYFAKFIFIEGLFDVPLVLLCDTLHWGNFSQYFKWTF